MRVWKILYPIGIHFAGIQAVATLPVLFLMTSQQRALPSSWLLYINLAGTLISVPFTLWLFQRDQKKRGICPCISWRQLSMGNAALLLFMGMGLSQYLNMLLNVLQLFNRFPQYTESMDAIWSAHSPVVIFLWSALAAPLSEELVFRWLIYKRLRDWTGVKAAVFISSVLFGLYHGNVVQFLYAAVMGCILALVIEWTGSPLASILVHMGANLWSTIVSLYGTYILENELLLSVYSILMIAMLAGIIGGFYHFVRGSRRFRRKS